MEINDLKGLKEMIEMNVINEIKKCVKKVDMVGIDVEECKGDIRELKGKIIGMKNGGNVNNSPVRRIAVNSTAIVRVVFIVHGVCGYGLRSFRSFVLLYVLLCCRCHSGGTKLSLHPCGTR